jgi:hypothetical protein
MYFNDFPTINYDCTGDGITEKIQDITTRITVRKWIREIGPLFAKYDVADAETPEMVAATVYGNVYDHWVVLLFNEITNTYYGWPLSRRDFDAFVNNKYENPEATHHYEITQSSGNQRVKINVMSTVAGATAVTNLEYEQVIQDKKKQIRVLKPTYLGQFKAEFQELLY